MPAALVETVVNAARDEHPSFTLQHTGIMPALRFLDRWQREVASEIARLRPAAVHVDETITLPLADFDAGHELPENYRVHGATAVHADGLRRPVVLVGYRQRLDRSFVPSAYIHGRQFFPRGVAEDWTDVATIVVDLFPVPTTLTASTDALSLPGDPIGAATAAVAAFFARRSPPDSGVDRAALLQAQVSAVEAYLDRVTGRSDVTVHIAREDW